MSHRFPLRVVGCLLILIVLEAPLQNASQAASLGYFNSAARVSENRPTYLPTPLEEADRSNTASLGDIPAIAVVAGFTHTCALTAGGGVKCWGVTPTDVAGLSSGVSILASGGSHTCALTAGGDVVCWAEGATASNSAAPFSTRTTRTQISATGAGGIVTAIAVGHYHTCIVKDGGVMCWGENIDGQLGDGTTTSRATPVDVSGLPAGSGVTAIAAGERHTCALLAGGGLKCWGQNTFGQLGDATSTRSLSPVDVSGITAANGVTSIAAGRSHTCALAAGGVMCWGDGDYGQLGIGEFTGRSIPAEVIGLSAGSGIQRIATGAAHTCAITAGGQVKCWGNNSNSQLGDRTTTKRSTPVDVIGLDPGVAGSISAGGSHTCIVTSSKGIKCWGSNSQGQLGDGTSVNFGTPADVSGLGAGSGVTALAAGSYHNCAVVGGGLKCWGENLNGQLGDGTQNRRYSPAYVSGLTPGSGVTAVATGGRHSCAVVAGGVKCWGHNEGRLGDGTNTGRATPVDVTGLPAGSGTTAITAGEGHTCAVVAGGVKCWGASYVTPATQLTPVDVSGLPAGSGVVAISAGDSHTCALLSSGGVKCWGGNSYGQLGNNTWTLSRTPADVFGLGAGSGVTSIGAGDFHTCAVIAGGAKCWGRNNAGQLGDWTTDTSNIPVDVNSLPDGSGVTAIAAGGYPGSYHPVGHTCALAAGGGARCWGHNTWGELGDGSGNSSHTPVDVVNLPANSSLQAIAAGTYHSCTLTSSGGVKCWGANTYGQVGVNSGTTPVDVIGFGPPNRQYVPMISKSAPPIG
jgi:alpha-tubulin suppressor-like RCC1 family protein